MTDPLAEPVDPDSADLAFTIYGNPQPQGSKVRTRWGMHDDNAEALAPWRDSVIAAGQRAMAGREPITEPVRVNIVATYPRPGNHWGTGRNAGKLKPSAPIHHTGKPDIDKVCRSILDGLTIARVWTDDRQVFELHSEKRWGGRAESPRADVQVFLP